MFYSGGCKSKQSAYPRPHALSRLGFTFFAGAHCFALATGLNVRSVCRHRACRLCTVASSNAPTHMLIVGARFNSALLPVQRTSGASRVCSLESSRLPIGLRCSCSAFFGGSRSAHRRLAIRSTDVRPSNSVDQLRHQATVRSGTHSAGPGSNSRPQAGHSPMDIALLQAVPLSVMIRRPWVASHRGTQC